jgi:cyanophycin synthetase
VTNISSDHLGLGGIETLEQLAKVKQVVIENVHRDGAAVLNAEDAYVAEMAAATDAKVVYFGSSPDHHIIHAHLAEGGSAVFIQDGMVTIGIGELRIELVEIERVAFTYGGKIKFQVANTLAATAAAWAAGLNPAMIARALTTFRTDADMMPGRFNVSETRGVEMVLDYGHNEAAMRALGGAIEALGRKRTLMVIGLPGDRRPQDIAATIDATIPFVDEYLLHDLEDRRGQPVNAIPEQMAARLPGGKAYTIVASQHDAVFAAWKLCKPGDRLIIIADIVDETLKSIQMLNATLSQDLDCDFPVTSAAERDR